MQNLVHEKTEANLGKEIKKREKYFAVLKKSLPLPQVHAWQQEQKDIAFIGIIPKEFDPLV